MFRAKRGVWAGRWQAEPIPATIAGAVVPRQRWWLKVLGEQGDRAAADPAVLPRLADDVAGARDLVPQLVQLAQQLDGVLLQRGPVRTAPRVAALRALLRSNPPPVLQLLQIAPHGGRLPAEGRLLPLFPAIPPGSPSAGVVLQETHEICGGLGRRRNRSEGLPPLPTRRWGME